MLYSCMAEVCIAIYCSVCVCVKVIEPCRSAGWTQGDVQAFFHAYIEAGTQPSMLFTRYNPFIGISAPHSVLLLQKLLYL